MNSGLADKSDHLKSKWLRFFLWHLVVFKPTLVLEFLLISIVNVEKKSTSTYFINNNLLAAESVFLRCRGHAPLCLVWGVCNKLSSTIKSTGNRDRETHIFFLAHRHDEWTLYVPQWTLCSDKNFLPFKLNLLDNTHHVVSHVQQPWAAI